MNCFNDVGKIKRSIIEQEKLFDETFGFVNKSVQVFF